MMQKPYIVVSLKDFKGLDLALPSPPIFQDAHPKQLQPFFLHAVDEFVVLFTTMLLKFSSARALPLSLSSVFNIVMSVSIVPVVCVSGLYTQANATS